MIFLRSTLREFAITGVAVFSVLLAITFSSALIRYLGLAARGTVPADAVMVLLALSALSTVSVLLSATVFLSVLLTMTRAYRDSEMVVWQTSGLSLLGWFRPVLLFVAPVMVLVAVLSIYMTPWAIGKAEQFRHQLENRDDATAIAPGVFKESKNADRVFFIEKLSPDLTQVANIFVHEVRDGRMWVGVASRGYLEKAKNGDRYLVALNGRRYSGTPGQADYRVEAFGKYAVRIEQSAAKSFLPSQKSRATALAAARSQPRQPGRAVVALRSSRRHAAAGFAGDPDERGEPAHGSLPEPARGSVRVHDLQQPDQHRAGLDCAGQGLGAGGDAGRARRHGPAADRAVRAAHRLSAPAQPGARGMRVLRRYIRRQVLSSILLVLAGLLMLFSFFDLIYEMRDLGAGNTRLTTVLTFVALSMPGRLYELFPIAALIGTLFALAQLVVSSEFAVMRTSGVSILGIGSGLLQVGLALSLAAFLVGEFVTPMSEEAAQRMRLAARPPAWWLRASAPGCG